MFWHKRNARIALIVCYCQAAGITKRNHERLKKIATRQLTPYAHAKLHGKGGIIERSKNVKIKNNKVINLFAYDEPNWRLYGIKTNFVINPETNELKGYASGSDPSGSVPLRFKINMNGVFVGNKFAGEGNVELTSPDSIILEKFIFESID